MAEYLDIVAKVTVITVGVLACSGIFIVLFSKQDKALMATIGTIVGILLVSLIIYFDANNKNSTYTHISDHNSDGGNVVFFNGNVPDKDRVVGFEKRQYN